MELAFIEKNALALAPKDRVLLAEQLLKSVEDPSILSAWVNESETRIAAFDRGEIEAHDAEAAIADIRSSLSQ